MTYVPILIFNTIVQIHNTKLNINLKFLMLVIDEGLIKLYIYMIASELEGTISLIT